MTGRSGRYDIYFGNGSYYGGLHCGDCFDVEMDGDWVPVRIEMDDDWYLVGVPKIRLDGLTVRAGLVRIILSGGRT